MAFASWCASFARSECIIRFVAKPLKVGFSTARGVVGAGPGGLMQAIVLLVCGYQVTIYESRQEFTRENLLAVDTQDLVPFGAEFFFDDVQGLGMIKCKFDDMSCVLASSIAIFHLTFPIFRLRNSTPHFFHINKIWRRFSKCLAPLSELLQVFKPRLHL